MNEIRQQVARARRRLVTQQFLSIVPWCLFAVLLVAVIGLAVPKIWVLNVSEQVWTQSWLAGACGAGLVLAILWTYFVRRNAMEAAIEIDRRFALKERVSSVLSLGPEELETEIGKALLADASRVVGGVEVAEQFGVKVRWPVLMPLVPAALAVVLVLLPNAEPPKKTEAAEHKVEPKKQIEKSAEELKKRIEQQRKQAEEKGLKDAEVLLKQLEKGLTDLADKEKADPQKAMVKLNDLKSELEKRRQELGNSDKLRDQMNQMKDIQKGPADKLAKSIKDGDFNKAMDELNKLQEQLKGDNLNEEQKAQLAQQLEQMQKKLEQMADAHEQAKRDLEEQIKQLEKQGNRAEAGKLQQKLDQMKQMDKQVNRMQQMANKLGKCSECMKNGDGKQAGQQLDQLAQDLQEMQKELDELETVNDALEKIADAKNAMQCKNCDGEGCAQCQGNGFGNGGDNMDGPPGFGLGRGRGQGERPEAKTDTGFFDSQVRGKLQKGQAVAAGFADGPNIAGKSREEIKQEIETTLKKDPEPLTNQRLPRTQREHAKQYFDKFRKGE